MGCHELGCDAALGPAGQASRDSSRAACNGAEVPPPVSCCSDSGMEVLRSMWGVEGGDKVDPWRWEPCSACSR